MKILISDIDSSMMNINNQELMNSINKFVNMGNKFIVATDKSINYIADTLSIADLISEYYICNDGAAIFDRYFNIIYRKDLNQNVVRPIFDMLSDDNNILETYVDTSHGFVKDTRMCANGIVARPIDKVKAEVTLNSITLKYPSVHGHVSNNWLNIFSKDVNKGTALSFLNENYRLNIDNVYVFGKDVDDLELMEKYNGYLLTNSCDDLKKYSKGEVNSLKELVDYLIEEQEKEELSAIYE